MPREAPEIRLIRETLEGVLHPSTASTVFFEALQDRGGTLPAGIDEALDLVRGPLAQGLRAQLGAEPASSVLEQLERLLTAAGGSAFGARRVKRRSVSRHEMPTNHIRVSDVTLTVFVLAGSSAFADRLRAALGPNVMSPVWAPDAQTLALRLGQVPPAFVVIDGSDFPAIEPSELVERLQPLPSHVVLAVWGTDLPYGMRVLDAAQQRGVTVTPLDRREGIEPLMDMIRSRRG